MEHKKCEVLIIGGGISGGSLLYLLAHFTDIPSLCLIEKYDHLDPLNSNAHANSQTLHAGDIETNYNYEKAKHVRDAAQLTLRYVQKVSGDLSLSRRYGKMLLAVGEKEIQQITQRSRDFQDLYPTLELINRDRIAELEPKVAMIEGKFRPDPIAALYNPEGYAVDYGRLTENFVAKAKAAPGKEVAVDLSTEAGKIERVAGGFEVHSKQALYHAKFVVVSAGSYSLLLAQKMGYGKDLSVLPVTGSFYFTPRVLNMKVYTVQNPKLPFAAIHGDPDMTEPDKTRFGPTALVLPVLERFNAKSAYGFIESFNFDQDVAAVLYHLMKDKEIRDFIYRNIGYHIPIYGKHSFLEAAQKIVPSLTLDQLDFAEHTTGVRPQIIDKARRQLVMGAGKIDEKDGIIFNMTPSPGATSALQNAVQDMHSVAPQLDRNIQEEKFKEIFGESS